MKKRTATKKLSEVSSSKEIKLPLITNTNSQNNKSKDPKRSITKNSSISELSNTKNKYNVSPKTKFYKSPKNSQKSINIITSSYMNENEKKISKSKIEEYNEKRKKRLEQERKEEEKGRKIYEEMLKEYEEKRGNKSKTKKNLTSKSNSNNNNDIVNDIKLPKIKISEEKAQQILEEGGMLDAYKYLIEQLCKNGLPEGNLFEYASYVIQNYEKKWKIKKSLMNKEKVENYWKEKKEEIKNNKNMSNEIIKAINRSLEERKMNKIIQSLDRSRSSLHHKDFPKIINKINEKKMNKVNTKYKLFIEQKGGRETNKYSNDNETIASKIFANDKKKNSIISNKSPKEANKTVRSIKSLNKSNSKFKSPPTLETKKDVSQKKK